MLLSLVCLGGLGQVVSAGDDNGAKGPGAYDSAQITATQNTVYGSNLAPR
ncbi:hypothetical protein K7711_43355 [Nocardia sp. CA2R105]|nr:hypothetical protein [Nocardia coffeae]MBY8863368.1 hypothetical protein [Nocardia coffeae]